MEGLVTESFLENLTEIIPFLNVSDVFGRLPGNHSNGTLFAIRNEAYSLENDTNSTELYWLDSNQGNFSFPISNFSVSLANFSFPLDNFTGTILGNSSTESSPEIHMVTKVLLSAILGLIILATVVGNVFVIAAIFLERNLQTVGNYLVFSLAVADLMVALLVMPMGALYEVNQEWILGPELCEVWTSGDVLCCTASILHLVAIAMDRFWAVTNVDYVRQRSSRRIGLMIFLVWAVGVLVSFAPVLGWKDDDFLYRIEKEKR